MPARSLSSGQRRRRRDQVQASADRVAMARALLIQSEMRRGLLPGLLRQPAWDMLLAAYVALHESVELSPTALCAYSGEPVATACRWLRKLEEEGLVRPRRGRRDAPIIVITKRAALGLEQLLEHLISESSGFARPA